MDELKEQLISEAQAKYKNIKPCRGDVFSDESFTTHNGKLVFWFNLEDNSTKIIMSESHFYN